MLSERDVSAWQGTGTCFPWQPACVFGAGKKCPGENQLQGVVEKSHVGAVMA